MAYLVKFMQRAERDMIGIFLVRDAEHSDAARNWYFGLQDAIFTLEDQPTRCPETPENRKLRQLLYGSKPHVYRIIYRILEKQQLVEVVHVRHGARKTFGLSEFK